MSGNDKEIQAQKFLELLIEHKGIAGIESVDEFAIKKTIKKAINEVTENPQARFPYIPEEDQLKFDFIKIEKELFSDQRSRETKQMIAKHISSVAEYMLNKYYKG